MWDTRQFIKNKNNGIKKMYQINKFKQMFNTCKYVKKLNIILKYYTGFLNIVLNCKPF